MKKFILFIFLTIQLGYQAFSQEECVYCSGNILGATSSAIGENNENYGVNSITIGNNNFIHQNLQGVNIIGQGNTANYNGDGRSIVLGVDNVINSDESFILGRQDTVSGFGGVAIGTGTAVTNSYSFGLGTKAKANGLFSGAIGNFSYSDAKYSFSFGTRVRSTAEGAIIIGSAPTNHNLTNDNLYSLMVGFNSDLPTLFVNYSLGLGRTGQIGIGNVTEPEAKLHIRADAEEDANLRLENTGDGTTAGVYFGDGNMYLKAADDMEFRTEENRNFRFTNGDIFIEDIDHGIVMKSPDGNCWRGTLNNQGQLQFTQVDCDELTVSTPETEPVQNYGIRIYPNPTGNRVTVEIPAGKTDAQLSIKSSDGKQLATTSLTGTSNPVDMTGYPAGVYFFYISVDGKLLEVKKVVKE